MCCSPREGTPDERWLDSDFSLLKNNNLNTEEKRNMKNRHNNNHNKNMKQ